MAVLTAPAAPFTPSLPQTAGPSCTLQRVAPEGAPGNSASLWQLGIKAQVLTTAIGQLAEQLETDDDDSRAQALAELEAALALEHNKREAFLRKADATCWVIERLRAEATYHQGQSRRFAALAKREDSRADALESTLIHLLTQLQPSATRFSFPNHELSSRKSTAVVIDDEQALDSEWLAVTTTSKPDKAAIKDALKAGQLIPGAQLISRRSWRIC